MKRKFETEKLFLTLMGDLDGYELVENKIIDQRRWSTEWEMIFKHEDKFYRTLYEQGSTEMQDTRLWDGQKFEYCEEVKPVVVEKIEYKVVL